MLHKLSINIITYNRAEKLKKLFDDLKKQKYSNIFYRNKKLSISIFDNSSEQNYKIILKEYKKIFNIKYIKHKYNIGFFENYIFAIKNYNKSSQYIWILSDDERLKDNALQQILDVIKKENISIISPGYNRSIHQNNSKDSFQLVKKDFDKKICQIGNISNLIFNIDLIKKIKINFGSNKAYPHFEIFLKLYNINSKWLYNKTGLLIEKSKNFPRDDKGNEIGTSSYDKSQNYISSRFKADFNEYAQLIRKIKISDKLKFKSINTIFSKNIRPWLILNSIYCRSINLKNNSNKNFFFNNLSLSNKSLFKLITFIPKKFLYKIFIFKNFYLVKLFRFIFIKDKDLKISFLIVGMVNTFISYLVGILTYYILFNNYGFHIMNLANIIIGMTISFLNFKFFTFKTKIKYIYEEYLKSLIVYGIKALIGSCVLWLFLVQFKTNIYISQGISILSTVIITFFGHKNYTFKKMNKS